MYCTVDHFGETHFVEIHKDDRKLLQHSLHWNYEFERSFCQKIVMRHSIKNYFVKIQVADHFVKTTLYTCNIQNPGAYGGPQKCLVVKGQTERDLGSVRGWNNGLSKVSFVMFWGTFNKKTSCDWITTVWMFKLTQLQFEKNKSNRSTLNFEQLQNYFWTVFRTS